MTDAQLYLVIGVPVFAVMVGIVAGILQMNSMSGRFTSMEARLTSLEASLSARLTSLETSVYAGFTSLDSILEPH